jgi:predicted small secreted protein
MKLILSMLAVLFIVTGCSKTIEGVKQDSKNAWEVTKEGTQKAVESTKKVIHEATE